MSQYLTIEVCIDSIESAESAIRGGADRLEVCGNLGVGGGTTPSIGLIKLLRFRFPNIPLMAMIRPRTGDFVYSEEEISIMLEDIAEFKNAGVYGVVIGSLNEAGTVNVEQTKRLVAAASSMDVTFHRAFDMTANLEDAFSTLAKIPGVTRILTRILTAFPGSSGGGPSAPGSLETLRRLLALAHSADSAPAILPGSGINVRTIRALLDELLPLGLEEVHLSGGHWVNGRMEYRKEGMGMGVGGEGEWGIWRTSEEAVKSVREIVDEAARSVAD